MKGSAFARASVMNIGGQLERARRDRGLSLEDISTKTRISFERLLAIEQNDVDNLPPTVYLRGFLRAYATEVGLDPDDIVARYMDQLEMLSALNEFASESAEHADDWDRASPADSWRAHAEGPSPSAPAPLWRRAQFLPHPLRHYVKTRPQSPMDQLTHASEPMDDMREPSDDDWRDTSSPAAAPRTTTARIRVGYVLIAALFAGGVGYLLSVNWDRLTWADLRAAVGRAERDERSADNETPTVSPPAVASEKFGPVTASSGAEKSVTNVSGQWAFTHHVESSSYKPFENLTLVYRVQLQQHGNRVAGNGHKWSENGRTIPPGSRIPISLEGTLNGRRLVLNLTERGRQRASRGTLFLDVSDDGSLRGSFVSDAAQSRGSSHAQRVP